MDDKIFLEGLEVDCVIGVFDWERDTKQKVVIDFEIPIDARTPAKKDDIKCAVDYKAISKQVIEFVSKSHFNLIETLADRLAAFLLKEFKIPQIRVRVSKPGAIRGAKTVGIEVVRKKK